MILPLRKQLPHGAPAWVRGGAVFFVTVCGAPRGENQFCLTAVAKEIFSATEFYQTKLRWWVDLLLLMPDHVHLLASFPEEESMKRVVAAWKHYLAKKCGIRWQRDFFDHRLRAEESFEEKAHYVRQNPVRAGLAETPETWAFVWEASRR